MLDITNMTIVEINSVITKLENDLQYYLNKKEDAYQSMMPKAVVYDKEAVEGGIRTDKYGKFIITIDECDNRITTIQNELNRLNTYICNELKRLNEYEPLKKKIIELRETEKKKWDRIAFLTNYSERQCRRIYKQYKKCENK